MADVLLNIYKAALIDRIEKYYDVFVHNDFYSDDERENARIVRYSTSMTPRLMFGEEGLREVAREVIGKAKGQQNLYALRIIVDTLVDDVEDVEPSHDDEVIITVKFNVVYLDIDDDFESGCDLE